MLKKQACIYIICYKLQKLSSLLVLQPYCALVLLLMEAHLSRVGQEDVAIGEQ